MMTVASIRLPVVARPYKGPARKRIARAEDQQTFGALLAGAKETVIDVEYEEMIEPVRNFNQHSGSKYSFTPFFWFKGVYVNYYT